MTTNVHLFDHPLVQHKLTLLRKKETSTTSFRRLLNEIGSLMTYEVTRDMPMHEVEIETPLETMRSRLIDGKKLVFVPILRAGMGLLDGFLSVVPGARVGHIGLYRDPKTLVAVEYYFKMPSGMKERDAIVLDPMLATGNSAVAAVERLKEARPRSIRFVCLVSSPQGIATLRQAHPDVPIYTASVDRELNDHAYILPGLGDAGDRIFGTSDRRRSDVLRQGQAMQRPLSFATFRRSPLAAIVAPLRAEAGRRRCPPGRRAVRAHAHAHDRRHARPPAGAPGDRRVAGKGGFPGASRIACRAAYRHH
ncbi:MAG: uracil phosphoribosyltransferase [Betaproteobacteria bacterium]|nr:uracil phosphoribosyltransferase [Betaproteobacteria bacterium]